MSLPSEKLEESSQFLVVATVPWETDGEFTFEAGDELEVIWWNKFGWWYGKKVDEAASGASFAETFGWFPSLYVQPEGAHGVKKKKKAVAIAVSNDQQPTYPLPPEPVPHTPEAQASSQCYQSCPFLQHMLELIRELRCRVLHLLGRLYLQAHHLVPKV